MYQFRIGKPGAFGLAAFFFFAAAGCESHDSHGHWSYKEATGPENWGDLSAEFQACKLGKNQSPIDITDVRDADLPPLNLNYKDTSFEIVNNGHTIQINLENAGELVIEEDTYKLLQFHFHNPSEEAVEGQRFPLVAHFVHKSDAGELAVIALFFVTGQKNGLLEPVFSNMPGSPEETKPGNGTINPSEILGSKGYYAYNGSLTTPPCSEGVRWIVLKTPSKLSLEQLSSFKELYSGNARPLQPLNAREIMSSR